MSVEQSKWFTDALIRVGEPAPVEVLREGGKALHLRCTGEHVMLFPKLSYSLIDGEFGFGFQSEVSVEGEAQTIMNIPNPDTFDQRSTHLIVMATPFGVAFREF